MKRTLALILALLMTISLFAACSSKDDKGTGTTPSNGNGTTTTTPSGDQGGDQTDGGAATTPSGDGANAPASEGKTSITIGMVGAHDSSDPCSESSNDFITQMMLYDKIMEIDDHTGERVFRILDSFEWTDDVTMKLVLRQDVYFANGDQATGEDLLYTFYSQVKNVDGTDKARTDKAPIFSYIDFDKSYVDDDGFTVYIVWQQPYARAEPSLDACLIQKKFVEEHPETDEIWYTDPLGSGPYKITDMQHDAYITFTRRDDYWNKDYTYEAEQITLKFYSDETGMYVDYQNGVIDAMYNVSANIVEQVQSANTGVVNAVPNGACAILWFNESNEYLANAKVREAICYAIDMDAVGQIAFGSLYKKPHSFLPEGFEGYSEHEGYTFDLDRAQKALDESGYKGSDIKLHIIAMNDGTQPKVAETIQGYLSMLGITLEIETLDMGTALPKMLQRDGTDFQYFSKNGGNPTGELTQLVAGNGKDAPFQCSAIYDEEYNRICDETTWTTDHEKSVKGCEELDDWLYDNYYGIPVNDVQMALVYNPNVISSFDQCSILKGCLGSLTLA